MENYTLQYVSDLHLDNESPPFSMLIQPASPNLALCGDVGKPYSQIYRDFLKWCSERWAKVFIITGNHEYFLDKPDNNKTVEKIDAYIESLCKSIGPNLFFLQKGVFLEDKYKIAIIGATLWSAPNIRHWDKLVDGHIGDPGSKGEYNAIFKPDENTGRLRPLHPVDITSLHMDHRFFISKELGTYAEFVPKDYRVIVLTHHLPTYSLISASFTDYHLHSCYASDQESLLKEPVVAWICGHSHEPKTLRFDFSGTLVTMNPLGYKNQSKEKYSRTATIVVRRENFATRSS